MTEQYMASAPAAQSDTRTARSIRLTGSRLVVARCAWIVLVALMLGVFALSVPVHLRELTLVSDSPQAWIQLAPADAAGLRSLGLPVNLYAVYFLVLETIAVAGYVAIGALIYWRSSDDGMAIFVAMICLIYGPTSVPAIESLTRAYPNWNVAVDLVMALGTGSGLVLFYVFPTGRFVPSGIKWLAAVWIAWVLVWPFVPALNPDRWPFPLPFVAKTGWYATGILAQIYRYTRRATAIERQQTKWVVYGFTAAYLSFMLFNLPFMLSAPLQAHGLMRITYIVIAYPFLVVLPLLFVPVSLGVAILRYRLWDIDILINRSLVYGAVTGLLGLVYFFTVVGLQQVLRWLTGQTSDLAIVISTLAIALLFSPVQRRIQAIIDRRFYRRKYDAAQALSNFSVALRDDLHADLGNLTEDLLGVVQEAMQPTHISLWLAPQVSGRRSNPARDVSARRAEGSTDA